jgi:hypothetical protein
MIKSFILIFTIYSIIIEPSIAKAIGSRAIAKKLEGYQIKFEYEKYPAEREIAYQFYLNELTKKLYAMIKKEQIGIDLYDIDGDGKNEIFLYINGGDLCSHAGCPWAVLRQVEDGDKHYKEIPWGGTGNRRSSMRSDSPDILKVLNSVTLGYHDILSWATIWRWKGEYYGMGRVVESK